VDPPARRDRQIAAEAARLVASPDRPVIAAGSTGSMPATAALLETIARLPHGAVVLPGLDTTLDDEAWTLIGGTAETPAAAGHPQFAMQAPVARFRVPPDEVTARAPTRGRAGGGCGALRPARRRPPLRR